MITYENSINKIRVEAYTLYEFIQETGEVQATGATLCLDNDFFCQNMGGNYLAYFDMSEAQKDEVPELQEVKEQTEEANRRAEVLAARKQEDALAEIANADIGNKDDLAMASIPPLLGETIPFTKEQDEALASVDNTPSDVNTAATPLVIADGIPFTPEQDAALAQAPTVTPEQAENVNRRRGRPPRN